MFSHNLNLRANPSTTKAIYNKIVFDELRQKINAEEEIILNLFFKSLGYINIIHARENGKRYLDFFICKLR